MGLTDSNTLAVTEVAKAQRIKNYLLGGHAVLGRKDFTLNGETFTSAKTVLNSILPILDDHTNYLIGNPVSITGDTDSSNLLQEIYRKGNISYDDFSLAYNLFCYGNAYAYVYIDNGLIKESVINPINAYPFYNDYGEYEKFIEKYVNSVTQNVLEIEYYPDVVNVYKNGVLTETFENSSHSLPIHFTSGNKDRSNIFGVGLTTELIRINDEIEALISKCIDAVSTLSLNPIFVVSGQKLSDKDNADAGYSGTSISLDSGDSASYINAVIDSASVKLLLDQLVQNFWTVASCPSVEYGGSSTIANVSEVAMQILYNSQNALCKRVGYNLMNGFRKRIEIISNLIGTDLSNVNISYNMDRPIAVKDTLDALKVQYDMGAISKESIIRQSPLTANVAEEMALIEAEKIATPTQTETLTGQQ